MLSTMRLAATRTVDDPTRTGQPVCAVDTDGPVVRLFGELDLLGAPQVRAVLDDVMNRGDLPVLDIEHLTFIDSTGLGVVVGAVRRLALRGERLVVSGPSRAVRRVLHVTGIDAMVDLVEAGTQIAAVDRWPQRVEPSGSALAGAS